MRRLPGGLTAMRGADEPIPFWQAVPLGLQHALSMDVYIVPFLIGTALGLPPPVLAALIGAGLVAAGLASLIQSQLCLRLPLMQGPSYVPIGAMVAIAASSGGGLDGLGTATTALIPGALLLSLVGWPLRVFHRVIRRLVPPLVGGAVIVVVGITLMPVAIQADVLADAPDRIGANLLLALASGTLVVASSLGGAALGRRGTALRGGSVLVALLGGSLLAFLMGRLDLSPVAHAAWLSRPHLIGLDLPVHVSPSAIAAMLLVYAVVLAETTGTWLVVSAITAQPFGEKQADRGAFGEGLGCLLSAALCSTPVTGYSANGGVIALTGVASRRVFAVAALFLVAFGLCGKLAAFIACVPAPVIGGLFGVLCVVILMNGLRILAQSWKEGAHDERTAMVGGLPILLGLGTALLPPSLVAGWPLPVRELFGSATAVGAGAAVLLNLVLPARRPAAHAPRAARPAGLPLVQTETTLAREAP